MDSSLQREQPLCSYVTDDTQKKTLCVAKRRPWKMPILKQLQTCFIIGEGIETLLYKGKLLDQITLEVQESKKLMLFMYSFFFSFKMTRLNSYFLNFKCCKNNPFLELKLVSTVVLTIVFSKLREKMF